MADEIRIFDKDIGTWDGEIEVRPQPGAAPQRSRGVMVNRVVGGRWLVSDFRNEAGFEGHGIYGWDEAKQAYVGTWVDAMRGSLVIAEGTLEREARRMTYRFELTKGGQTMRWRDVTEFPADDVQVFRSFLELPGGELEVVTATYRKRRGDAPADSGSAARA